MLQIKHFTNVE